MSQHDTSADLFELILIEIISEIRSLNSQNIPVSNISIIHEICEKYHIEDIEFAKIVRLKRYRDYYTILFEGLNDERLA